MYLDTISLLYYVDYNNTFTAYSIIEENCVYNQD